MLSILIPVYDYNVYPLARELEKQAVKAAIDFEIVCFDDGSLSKTNDENEKINTLTNSTFLALKKNIGLSSNRNALAKDAKYKYLLFIDGDSLIPDKNFIVRYLDSIKDNIDVVYGGRIHPKTVESNRKLRWKYGIYREDLNSNQRKKNKYKCVLFNNTVIKKSVFNNIGFESKIKQYGHEDTLFAYNLSKIKASIKHIDNPVLHGDVDLNEVFFMKRHKAIENLNLIYNDKLINPSFVTFLRIFEKLKRIKLNYIFAIIHRVFYPIFSKNLTSERPLLFVFNLFRLSYFCHINLKK
ncbi:glycosyltransferase family 2 protein [Flavivirga eckloniae]|uniref:Glycosyl transferase n=1 Tax=Flavivirga eckloniae TaxID=1803846 RepID=A0A2K9PNY5_9FLAO|nr:glycosyltransferase family 2 protein [Flavivirga eckloniae]AUP78297.1 glycosyl transferase [Flavivirga eckloniae]